jgi:excisionase family DNA binding protein
MSLPETIEAIDNAITVAELAILLNLSRTTLYDMARRGAIPHCRIGGSVRFDPHAIAAWLRSRTIK